MGERRGLGWPVAVAVVYLLVGPWGFLLGPLVGLLIVSRPSTRREWTTLGIAAPLLVLSLVGAGSLFEQFIRSASMLLTGAFLVTMMSSPGSAFRRAAAAVAAAALAAFVWISHFGIGWLAVQQAGAAEIRSAYTAMATQAGAESGAAVLFSQVAATADRVAALYPGLLVLSALAGLMLAWRIYHAVATHPIGPEPAPFRAFRFGDQFVWVPVFALAALVLPVSDRVGGLSIRTVAENVLLVCLALYTARGLAVFSTVGRNAPRSVLGVLSLVGCLLFPFAASGLALLGLADSWVDFRRRLAPPPTGGIQR